jgi:hypothetical protein
MDILNKTKLEKLMMIEKPHSVSIYLPTHRAGVETQQDPIQLKNLLKEAEKNLSAHGLGPREIQKILEPADKLLKDSRFWQHQSDGLVIFLASSRMYAYRLPLDFEKMVIVDDHFYMKPLLPLFTGDGHFYILALSQNHLRLLNCTRYSISEIDITQVIGTMEVEMSFEDRQVNLQSHASGSAGEKSGNNQVTFHGQDGGSNEDAKKDLLRYFHLVDDGVMEFLQEERMPLVLAGVEYLLPIYKEANTYPNLIDTVIPGNPDLLSAEKLQEKAWEIVGPLFQSTQEEAIAEYKQLAGQDSKRIANTLETIIPAAYQGQIETIFVTADVQQSGIYHPETNKVEIHEQPESGDEYLLDQASVHTYLKGGKVYVMEEGNIPGGTKAAAVLRY